VHIQHQPCFQLPEFKGRAGQGQSRFSEDRRNRHSQSGSAATGIQTRLVNTKENIMGFFTGKTAIVTGAGSGIGYALDI